MGTLVTDHQARCPQPLVIDETVALPQFARDHYFMRVRRTSGVLLIVYVCNTWYSIDSEHASAFTSSMMASMIMELELQQISYQTIRWS